MLIVQFYPKWFIYFVIKRSTKNGTVNVPQWEISFALLLAAFGKS